MSDSGVDLGSQIGKLTPQQRQAVLLRAQQEANTQIMQKMMEKMVSACYDKCTGTSVRTVCVCCTHIAVGHMLESNDDSNRSAIRINSHSTFKSVACWYVLFSLWPPYRCANSFVSCCLG